VDGPFCAECGKPLPAGAKFCPACGTIAGTEASENPRRRSAGRRVVLGVVTVVVVAGVAAVFLTASGERGNNESRVAGAAETTQAPTTTSTSRTRVTTRVVPYDPGPKGVATITNCSYQTDSYTYFIAGQVRNTGDVAATYQVTIGVRKDGVRLATTTAYIEMLAPDDVGQFRAYTDEQAYPNDRDFQCEVVDLGEVPEYYEGD
jgi:hypothetical protein